jgi:hypothetical protein
MQPENNVMDLLERLNEFGIEQIIKVEKNV